MPKIILFIVFLLFFEASFALAGKQDDNKPEQSGKSQDTNEKKVEFSQDVPSHNKPSSISPLNEIKQATLFNNQNSTASDQTQPQKILIDTKTQIEDQPTAIKSVNQLQANQFLQQQAKRSNQTDVISSVEIIENQKPQEKAPKSVNLAQTSNIKQPNQATALSNDISSLNIKEDFTLTKDNMDKALKQQNTNKPSEVSKKQNSPNIATVNDIKNMPQAKNNLEVEQKQKQQPINNQLKTKNLQFVKSEAKNVGNDSRVQAKNENGQIQKKINAFKKQQQIIDNNKKVESMVTKFPQQMAQQIEKTTSDLIENQNIKQDNNKSLKNIIQQGIKQKEVKQQNINTSFPSNSQKINSENAIKTQNIPQQPIIVSQKVKKSEKSVPQITIITLEQQENEDEDDREDLKQLEEIKSIPKNVQQQKITPLILEKQKYIPNEIQNRPEIIQLVNTIEKFQQPKNKQQKHEKTQVNPKTIITQQQNVKKNVEIIQKSEINIENKQKGNLSISQISKNNNAQEKQILQKPIQQKVQSNLLNPKEIEDENENDIKQTQQDEEQQLQSKQQIQNLLKEIKTQLNQKTKNKIIKHLQKDIELKELFHSNQYNNIGQNEQEEDDIYLNLQAESQQKNENDKNMDKTTIIVLLLLTFIISIPIVKQIRIKANRNPTLHNQNQSQNPLDQTNKKKQAQFYKQERDIFSQTGLGICQTE